MTVGKTIIIKTTSRDPAPPPLEYVKGGGGLFKDMAIHDIDICRWLANSEAKSVSSVDKTFFAVPRILRVSVSYQGK